MPCESKVKTGKSMLFLSVELNETCLEFLVNDSAPCVFGLRKSHIEVALVGAHLSLIGIILLAEGELTSAEEVFMTSWIAYSGRQEGHACSFRHSATEASSLNVGALWSVCLSQSLLEFVDVVDRLGAIGRETTLVKTDITVAAGTI